MDDTIIIRVQNQDNLPDLIREFEITPRQLVEITEQLDAGVEIIVMSRPDGKSQQMSFPRHLWKGIKS